MIQFYKPNSQNTGNAFGFRLGSKAQAESEPCVYMTAVQQHSWNAKTKNGSFAENAITGKSAISPRRETVSQQNAQGMIPDVGGGQVQNFVLVEIGNQHVPGIGANRAMRLDLKGLTPQTTTISDPIAILVDSIPANILLLGPRGVSMHTFVCLGITAVLGAKCTIPTVNRCSWLTGICLLVAYLITVAV